MLRNALTFLILAVVAGLFGFGNIAAISVDIAQILFFIFLIGLVVSVVLGITNRKGTNI